AGIPTFSAPFRKRSAAIYCKKKSRNSAILLLKRQPCRLQTPAKPPPLQSYSTACSDSDRSRRYAIQFWLRVVKSTGYARNREHTFSQSISRPVSTAILERLIAIV